MALDSATKRRSMLAMGVLALIVQPVPDATIAAIDQKHFLGLMAAVATQTGLATSNLNIVSISAAEPNHVSDSGNNLLLAGAIEAKGGGYFGGPTDYIKLTPDGNALVPTGKVFIGPTASMLALLNITGDAADIGDRHEGLWMRVKEGAWILQLNVRGPRLEIGGGASLDTTPAMSVNYNTGRVGIGTTTPDYILDIDAGEIGETNYDGLRIIDTGWKATSHPMLEFYNSHAGFNASLARIYGEIGDAGTNSKLYFAVADSSQNLQNRMVIDKSGDVGIGTTTPTLPLSVLEKSGHTTIGGFAVKLTNETGAVSVAGEIVETSTATANAVSLAGADSTIPVGVFLDSGIAEHAEAWIVCGGIALVKYDAAGASMGDWIKASDTAGRAKSIGSETPGANHFREIGHALEDAAANATGKILMHFN